MLYTLSPTSFAAGRNVPSSNSPRGYIGFLCPLVQRGVPIPEPMVGCVLVAFGDSATERVVFKRHGFTVIALSVSKGRKSSPQRQERSYIRWSQLTNYEYCQKPAIILPFLLCLYKYIEPYPSI